MITILPPWYRTYAAYFSYFLILFLSVRSFGKYQSNKSLEKAENQRRAGELEEAKKFKKVCCQKFFLCQIVLRYQLVW